MKYDTMKYEYEIQLLKKARKLIAANKEPYICWAIDTADGVPYTAANRWLEKWIHSMLSIDGDAIGTLELWLYYKGYITQSQWDKINGGPGWWTQANPLWKKLSKTRVAWIDWMIEELER